MKLPYSHRAPDITLLSLAVAFLQLAAPLAVAAEVAATSDSGSLEEIVVTGSRIKGVESVGSNVISIDPGNLIKSPSTNLVDMLRRLPQLSGYGSNVQMKSAAGPGVSGAGNGSRVDVINLRGIGPSSTLVLFDGVRAPGGGPEGIQIDMTSLPILALQRVELVADGASAIYGSDAVAGVINFVPKRRVDHWETRGQFGYADGINTTNLAQTIGGDWGSGGWMLAAQYQSNGHLNGTERDYYRSDLRPYGGHDLRSAQCNPGTIIVGGVRYAIPAGGVTPATANLLVPNTSNRCELYRTGDIISKQSRESAYFNIDQDIGERFNVFARGTFAYRKYDQDDYVQGSSSQVVTFNVPATNAFFVRPPGTTGTVSVDYFYGPDQAQPLRFDGMSRYQQFIGGGSAKLWGDWQANFKSSWSRTRDSVFSTSFLAAQQTAALASNDPNRALNPFAPNDPAKVAYIFSNYFNPFGNFTMQTDTLDIGGSLFHTPGGDVRVAAGYDYTHFDILTGNYRGAVDALVYTQTPTNRTVNAVFAELFVPLVGADNALPGVRRLDLSIAGRRDDYSDVGRTTNPKFGVNWSPLNGLLLKASYGTSFKAPAPNNLIVTRPGSALILYQVNDPLTGQAVTGLNLNAGNPDLKPEEAKTYSFSAEVKPVWAPGLSLNATFFTINDTQSFLSVAAASALSNPLFAPFVTRNPTQAQINAIVARFPQLTVQAGTLSPLPGFVVDTRPMNSGGFRLQGIDFSGSYERPTSHGDFYFTVDGTVHTKWEVKLTDNAVAVGLLNRFNNILKFRGRGEVGWRRGPWTGELDVNYTNGYTNDQVTPIQQVSADTTFDVRGSYAYGDLTVTLGARNVLDKDPPFVDVQSGIDGSWASALGRVLSLTLDKRW